MQVFLGNHPVYRPKESTDMFIAFIPNFTEDNNYYYQNIFYDYYMESVKIFSELTLAQFSISLLLN